MPSLLTIPTEIRLKILDYAISDLAINESLIRRIDAANEDDWNYLMNPNVNVHLICRQIRSECNSPQVRKPILQGHEPRAYTGFWRCYYLRLKERSGLYMEPRKQYRVTKKILAQISMLRVVETIKAGMKLAFDWIVRDHKRQLLVDEMSNCVGALLSPAIHTIEVEVDIGEQAEITPITTTVSVTEITVEQYTRMRTH